MSSEEKVKQRKYRKRKLQDLEQQKQSEVRLESTLWLQQQRLKKSGLTEQQLSHGVLSEWGEGGQMYGLQLRSSDLLEAYVKEKTVSKTGDDNMEQYVEQEVAKRLGKKKLDQDEAGNEAARKEIEHELYQIPENLRGSEMGEVSIPGLNTAITEIQLPMKYKLKNIEATECAKKELLQQSRPTLNKYSALTLNQTESLKIQKLQEKIAADAEKPVDTKRNEFPLRFGTQARGEKWSEARIRY